MRGEVDSPTVAASSRAAERQAEAPAESAGEAPAPTVDAAADGATVAPPPPPVPARKLVAMRGDDRPGMKKAEPAGRDDRRGPGSRDGRDARGPRDAGRGPRDAWGDNRPVREFRGAPAPRLGDAAFRAQRQAVEHAEAALRRLAAQAHGEVLTQLLTAWEKRDPAAMPAAQALGARVAPAVRANWLQSLGAASPSAPAEALLRLEMAAEVPTPADQLDARRQLQLQLLTRRHDAPPSETWGQDVARLLSGPFDAEVARRLQNVLKVLLRK